MHIASPNVSFISQVFKTHRANSYILTILKRNGTDENDSAFNNNYIFLTLFKDIETSKTQHRILSYLLQCSSLLSASQETRILQTH